MLKLKPFVLTGFAVLAIAGWQTAALAATTQAVDTFGTTVSPPTLELDAVPGEVVQESIKVTNGSSSALTYLSSTADFHVEGTEGNIVVDNDDSSRYAAAQWIKVQQTSFSLDVKDTATINFTVTVPKNAEAGGHYAVVLFQPQLTSGPQGSGAATIPRIGVLVLISLPGATTEKAEIQSITPKSFVGSWDTLLGVDGQTKILVAKNENLSAEHPQRFFFSSKPIAFDTLFKNLGTVHVEPAGTMTITDLFGHKVAQLALDPQNVFPGTERRITTVWPGQTHWGFFYRAKVVALYGTQNQIMIASTWFIAFPLVVLIAVPLVLLAAFLVRKRLKTMLRILFKGE